MQDRTSKSTPLIAQGKYGVSKMLGEVEGSGTSTSSGESQIEGTQGNAEQTPVLTAA
ncbi:hypothetical protein BH09PLA1_BH09PLA1_23690 [soil metagenome]